MRPCRSASPSSLRAAGEFYTNWSYIEGIRAEDISRSNWCAEAAVLKAEAQRAGLRVLVVRRPTSTGIWKTILAAQHHDVYCFCSTELKDKAVPGCRRPPPRQSASSRARPRRSWAASSCPRPSGQARRGLRRAPSPAHGMGLAGNRCSDPASRTMSGRPYRPKRCRPATGTDGFRSCAVAGLGYATYWIHGGGEPPGNGCSTDLSISKTSTIVRPSCRTAPLPRWFWCHPARSCWMRRRSVVISWRPWTVPGSARTIPASWSSAGPGRAPPRARSCMEPHRAGPVHVSALRTTLTAQGQMGGRVAAELDRLLSRIPRIDLAWTFTFDDASIGTFYDDNSKLRVHWPLAFDGDIRHDIAFGSVREWEGRPFFPASWTDIRWVQGSATSTRGRPNTTWRAGHWSISSPGGRTRKPSAAGSGVQLGSASISVCGAATRSAAPYIRTSATGARPGWSWSRPSTPRLP